MSTGFFTHPIYLEHDTGAHPEHAGRLQAIRSRLEGDPLWEQLELCSGRRAEIHEVNLLHTRQHIDQVQQAAESGRSTLSSPDCVLSPKTFEAAMHAVGSVLDAVQQVATGRLDNAFCAVRPPGHHAEQGEAMGFCFFNNIALAAEFLIREVGLQRVAIVDFDVHHGNGTQHLFEERSDVFFISTHQHPRTCYPGTGFAEERGVGAGAGYTLNVPLLPGTEDAEYLQQFRQVVLPALEAYRPEFLLVSAGFDAHRADPLASLNLTETAFREVSRALVQVAERCCSGKVVSLLEGGYDLEALASSVQEHIREWTGCPQTGVA